MKQDSLASIVEFLATVGETPLLRARAKLAVGHMLSVKEVIDLQSEGYDVNYCAAYEGKSSGE